MSLTCKVQVTLNNISEKKAHAVRMALEPDNVNFPENLTLKVENVDNKLVFNFQSQGNMKKLIATVDEVLEHVQVALKVIE
jgi:tRNA threonylcarbamoyladenosine modification (KEOPS) complex  Pcc1 subunit